MKIMNKIDIVTSFSQAGYKEYAKRFLETFLEYFDHEIKLWVFYEREQPEKFMANPRIAFVNLLSAPVLAGFLREYGNNALIKARMASARKPFQFDALKFCRKVFAIEQVSGMTTADKLFWMDADLYAFAPVTTDFLDSLLPADAFLCHIGREGYHSECSMMGFHVKHAAYREFMDRYAGIYRTGRFLKEAEWHDSFLFDIVRSEMEVERKITSHNLTPGARRGGHPWLLSPMASCMDNLKGMRKQSGKSWKEDLEKAGVKRTEKHWQDLPSRTGKK